MGLAVEMRWRLVVVVGPVPALVLVLAVEPPMALVSLMASGG